MINIKLCMYIGGQRGNVMRPAQSGWFIFFGNTNASTKCHGNPSHDHPSILAKATNVRLLMSLEEKSVAISQLCCNILFIYRREQNPGTLDSWSKYVLAVCVRACVFVCVWKRMFGDRLRVLGHSGDLWTFSTPVAAECEQHAQIQQLNPEQQEGGEDSTGHPSISVFLLLSHFSFFKTPCGAQLYPTWPALLPEFIILGSSLHRTFVIKRYL